MTSPNTGRLLQRNGRLHLDLPDFEAPRPVRPLRPRPLTAPEVVVFVDDEDEDLWRINGLDELDPRSRVELEQALRERYYMPRIEQVTSTRTLFGTHYWEVVTNRGPASFALREPGKNVTWLNEHHCVIRDTVGNRFEMTDLRQLDPASRKRVLTIL